MTALDEDALICDFAQYYNIYDYMQYGVRKAAIYACGLPEDSRIKKKIQNRGYDMVTYWQVAIYDAIRSFKYAFSKVHYKDVEPPETLLDKLTGTTKGKDNETEGFESAEDFETALRKAKES